MATVTGYTAEYMDALMDENVVNGSVVGDDLILEKRDGSTINAGDVRGPAGTDAAPGDISPTAGTTPIRDAAGEVKTGAPTDADDATPKSYVDSAVSSLNSDIADLVSDVAALDSRLDVLEGSGLVARIDSHTVTANGTLSSSEANIHTVTIPNPINGVRYRATVHTNIVADGSIEARVRVKHGIGATTGGTQIAEHTLDHSGVRPQGASIVVEFVYGGTTGQSNYNVVVTTIPVTGQCRVAAASTRTSTLVVDRIL